METTLVGLVEVEGDSEPEVNEYLLVALRALEDLLTYVDNLALEQANFTAESWATFAAARATAQNARQSTEVDVVRAATALLEASFNGLVTVDEDTGDSEEENPYLLEALRQLEELLNRLDQLGLVEANFTADSWTTFAEARTIAQNARQSTEVDVIRTATALLEASFYGLVEVETDTGDETPTPPRLLQIRFVDRGEYVKQKDVPVNSLITAPVVTREGYTLVGWYHQHQLDNPVFTRLANGDMRRWNFANDLALQDVRLYAQWIPVTMEIETPPTDEEDVDRPSDEPEDTDTGTPPTDDSGTGTPPITDGDGTPPTDEQNGGSDTPSAEEENQAESDRLPQTNEPIPYFAIYVGILIMIGGMFFLLHVKKRRNQSN